MKLGFVALSLLLSFTPAHALVEKYDVGAGSKASFEAVGKPALMKIQGEGAPVTGSIEIDGIHVKGEFEVDLSKLTTGIESRDKHMKEKYLETEKFPKATLKIESISVPSDWKSGVEMHATKFKGWLTVKTITKRVEGEVAVASGEMAANATFAMKLSDYPTIGVPTYMGITVADNVVVTVAITKFVRK